MEKFLFFLVFWTLFLAFFFSDDDLDLRPDTLKSYIFVQPAGMAQLDQKFRPVAQYIHLTPQAQHLQTKESRGTKQRGSIDGVLDACGGRLGGTRRFNGSRVT